MADIDGLKQRIELIDLRLKTAHSARERESTTLVEIWEKIRQRLQSQNGEILSLRERIRALEDTRDDLQSMVDNLLGAVEDGLERMSDETVSNIREMASGLLNERETAALFVQESPAPGVDGAGYGDEADDDDFLAALERPMNATTNSSRTTRADSDNVFSLDTPIDVPVSSGIQDLVARIENSVGEMVADNTVTGLADVGDNQDSPEGLQQDLLEIEQLRNELLGLRERISGSGN